MKRMINLSVLLLIILTTIACKEKPHNKTTENEVILETERISKEIDPSNFRSQIDGKEVGLYTLMNKNGLKATFTNYGQRLISLYVPDKNGDFEDVVLGFPTLEGYINADEKYFGATIGRYGNRIAKGKFTLDGKQYELETNNGENHLHGGEKGFESVVWDANQISDNEIEFTRTSPDMEEGYPGNLEVKVSYLLTDDNELRIDYEAVTDKKTPINLTHHSFFNLRGEGDGTVDEHILMINADKFTPVDAGLIPTGELQEVAGTPFDFTKPKPIGQDLGVENQQLKYGGGYDHNFALKDAPKNEDGLVLAAKVTEPESGRVMEVLTDEPGLQFYGGNFLDGGVVGKSANPYIFRGAFCLETQHFPDGPNQPDFPNTILEPGDTYSSTCVYKFSTQP
ncbi:aldose epimerase family protein [Maribacter sp. 2307ULW6-5]|uniref:aldose epimerase family protein n=1 Tax=Maribacter sp. 2307ULW6-5 TaxID=3386275 RepID=UPI0039BD8D66